MHVYVCACLQSIDQTMTSSGEIPIENGKKRIVNGSAVAVADAGAGAGTLLYS